MMPEIGKHRARAVATKLGYASTGTAQVALQFAVVTNDGTQETGETIAAYLYLSDAAFDRSIEALRHCGWKGDDLSDLSTVGSQDCEIDVADEEYNGETKRKVKWINGLGRGELRMAEEMGPNDAKRFAAEMKAKIAALTGGQRTAAKPAPAARPAARPAQRPAQRQPAPPPDEAPADDIGF